MLEYFHKFYDGRKKVRLKEQSLISTRMGIFLIIFVGVIFSLDPLWSQSGFFSCWYFVKLFMFNFCLHHCLPKSARPVPSFHFLSKSPIFKG